jgi:hypothetical protein
MSMQKPSVKIDDWAVVPNPTTGRYRELAPGTLLVGRVSGHPRMEPGTFIFSSPVVRVDTECGIVETKNTAYVLGNVSSEYQLWMQHNAA